MSPQANTHLTCPHGHHIPPDTCLEFYCRNCRTNHVLPSAFLQTAIDKSHGEYLDRVIAKLVQNDSRICDMLQKIADVIQLHLTTSHGTDTIPKSDTPTT